MKVYVVFECEDERSDVLGVFSTAEKAQSFIDDFTKNFTPFDLKWKELSYWEYCVDEA